MCRTIVWFRRDLRIFDHEPLHRAASRGEVIPIFIFDRALLHHPETSSARVAFMLRCLQALDQDLRQLGGRLILKSGEPVDVLLRLLAETQAEGIYAHVDCERIYGRVRDARLNQALTERNHKIRWFEPLGSLPDLLPYPDYRQFWFDQMASAPVPTPQHIQVPAEIESESIPNLKTLGLIDDQKPIPNGGTLAARRVLTQFLTEKTPAYYWQLSYPSAMSTSGLSPYLKFGVISIRECYQQARQCADTGTVNVQRSCQQLISRIRWGSGFTQRFRYLPQLELNSLYTIFDQEGWPFSAELYKAWQDGKTGFPIVDAAARCLVATGGWQELNFRVRAIYASFLSNLLGFDWRYGALHFMRHLIDGDCPIDHYQWAMQAGVTHCLDKSWTRIYNPEQSAVARCDPEGKFVKRWLPELADVPTEYLGTPPSINGYPKPVIDYHTARQQRVQQLDRQRSHFRQQTNVLPYLTELPVNVMPFGTEQFSCEVGWAVPPIQDPNTQLFPPPLNLNSLDAEQVEALRSWLVAHVEIQPAKKRASRLSDTTDFEQLSIL
jgi:deoxyribodipyrimidine photo-lyase